jgi:hypothetical protein
VKRRNFLKGLCGLALAPLAAALPIPKPKASMTHMEPALASNEYIQSILQQPGLSDQLSVQGLKINYTALLESLFHSTRFSDQNFQVRA